METIITTEQDLSDHAQPIPKDVVLVYFKLIGVGPNTLAKTEHLGRKICEVVRQQPGFFVMSRGGSGLREAMHDLVDRFCNAQEGKYESTNS